MFEGLKVVRAIREHGKKRKVGVLFISKQVQKEEKRWVDVG